MKKFYFLFSIITMLIFQSCYPDHDRVLNEYVTGPYKVLCKRQYRQDDALEINVSEYLIKTTKTCYFVKESGEEDYRVDTITRTIIVTDKGTAYDKY